jgi:hypothetical protein
MQPLLVFGIPIICLWTTATVIRYYLDRRLLSARRFAIIISSGLGITSLSYFFLVLAGIELTIGMFGLGLGITLLNFIISYPIAWYFYKHFVEPRE